MIYVANIKLSNTGSGSGHVISFAEALLTKGKLTTLVLPRLKSGVFLRSDIKKHTIEVPTILPWPYGQIVFDFLACFVLIYLRILKGPDVVLIRPHFYGLFQYIGSRLSGHYTVVEMNGIYRYESQANGSATYIISLGTLFNGISLFMSNAVSCVTPLIASYCKESRWLGSKPAFVLPNAVNIAEFYPRSQTRIREDLNISRDTIVLGFVGSFAPWQGLRRFSEAVIRLPGWLNVKLLLIGGGAEESEIRKIQMRDKHDRIVLMEWINHDTVPEFISAMDYGVLVREWPLDLPLGSPLKLFEYLACGTKVIATKVDGMVNLDPGNSLINFVDAMDVGGLTNELEDLLLSYDRSINHKEILFKLVKKHHTWENRVTQLTDFIAANRHTV